MSGELKTQLESLKNKITTEEAKYYQTKMLIKPDVSKKYAASLIKHDKDKYYQRIFREYDMDYVSFGRQKILRCHLSPLQIEYVHAVSKFLCHNSNLKYLSTVIGKSAEMVFRNSINNLFHLFRINKKIEINSKNFVYGGDGGGDFFIGSMIFDVKYRNDSPAHGMILEKKFVENMADDTILIHVTNSISTKLSINDATMDQTLPLALSGWVSGKDFKQQASVINNSRESLALDRLNPIADLLFLVLEDHLDSEELFVY